jgi:hypothetical protein
VRLFIDAGAFDEEDEAFGVFGGTVSAASVISSSMG